MKMMNYDNYDDDNVVYDNSHDIPRGGLCGRHVVMCLLSSNPTFSRLDHCYRGS